MLVPFRPAITPSDGVERRPKPHMCVRSNVGPLGQWVGIERSPFWGLWDIGTLFAHADRRVTSLLFPKSTTTFAFFVNPQ